MYGGRLPQVLGFNVKTLIGAVMLWQPFLENYFFSDYLKTIVMNTESENKDDNNPEKEFPGYPPYPKSEDIYENEKRDDAINPDDNSVIIKEEVPNEWNERNPEGEFGADDLDIPGAELDDANEEIGREDEENNYYSLGGDNHKNLEEDQATGLD
jgi:hypothetical protein